MIRGNAELLSPHEREAFGAYVCGAPTTAASCQPVFRARRKFGLVGRSRMDCLAWTLVNAPELIDEGSPIGKALGRTLRYARFGQHVYEETRNLMERGS